MTSAALPPWRRGLPESLATEALPPIVLYQRLYQAVHGFKGGVEITDPTHPGLPLFRQCQEQLSELALATASLPAAAVADLQRLVDSRMPRWEDLLTLLGQCHPTAEAAGLGALELELATLDPALKADSFTKARLRYVAGKPMALAVENRHGTLAELEKIDGEVEASFLKRGGLLVSRSIGALTPEAKTIAAYGVQLRYVGSLPR